MTPRQRQNAMQKLEREMAPIEAQYGSGPFSAMPKALQDCYHDLSARHEDLLLESMAEDDPEGNA